jgi:hypothetical protein
VKPDFLELFRALDRAGVEHVVVGGVAAILEGAPIATLDLDIVYRTDDANLERLVELLEQLEARYRDPAGRDIRPTADRLAANKINLLQTSLGPLYAMQRLDPDWSWEEVVERSHLLQVEDLKVRVLELAAIIESKTATNRDKDRAMLPVLRRTLEQK